MIIISDYDDENTCRLKFRIKQNNSLLTIKSLELNNTSQNIEFYKTDENFYIIQGESKLSKKDFELSQLIFFYRWRMKDTPFVVSGLSHTPQKKFSEREWTSLIWGTLLFYEGVSPNKIWINRPSQYYILRNKYYLLSMANEIGFMQPYTYISNKILIEKELQLSECLVAKAISSDEQIDQDLYYRTSEIEKGFLEQNEGQNSDCPSYIQRYIEPQYEVRVYYLLGEIISLKISSEVKCIDIRDIKKSDLLIEIYQMPDKEMNRISEFCKNLSVNFCSFDFIFDSENLYLLDVTPNGSWSFYDQDYLITDWIIKILSNFESY